MTEEIRNISLDSNDIEKQQKEEIKKPLSRV